MNNLPLQPLVWFELESTNRLICEVVTPICEYSVWKDVDSVAYSVLYYNRHTEAPTKEATGFATIDEAKAWAWNHYNEKMQPYVKPMPTWIDVSERLPERKELLTDKDKCLVLTECGKVWTGFYNMHVKPDDWYLHGWTEKKGWHPFKIVAWMLASEFSTMQNNKGE